MAKLVHKFQFASHNRSLKDIKTYYDRVLDSLEYQYSREHNADYDVIFANKSEAEVAAELDRLKEELSMEGAFELLAYLEKVFRTDCHIRCTRRYKDDLSKSFKDVYKSVGKIQYKIGFVDVIVAGWKKFFLEQDPHNQDVLDMFSQINDFFNFRNWMAHGRYWDYPYSRGKHNFDVVWIMVNEVENAFSGKFYAYERVGERV